MMSSPGLFARAHASAVPVCNCFAVRKPLILEGLRGEGLNAPSEHSRSLRNPPARIRIIDGSHQPGEIHPVSPQRDSPPTPVNDG